MPSSWSMINSAICSVLTFNLPNNLPMPHRCKTSAPCPTRLAKAVPVHVAIIGCGSIGSELISQILTSRDNIAMRMHIDLKIFAIANSRALILNAEGLGNDWQECLGQEPETHDTPEAIIAFAQEQGWQNLILVDNTASQSVARLYPRFASTGFDLVSSNKKANTLPHHEYRALRDVLAQYDKVYRYETNVGAGLPLIDNVQLLHLSGENISSIQGLFSGSLSYIFTSLSAEPKRPLRCIIESAIALGYAEPDPREDLCGLDVARKVLILARELDINCELSDVMVENLIPEELRALDEETFWERFEAFEVSLRERLALCPQGYVPRYIGEVIWNDKLQQATLSAGLRFVPSSAPLAQTSGSDCCFEIYTESYGARPIIVQGAGAGTKVTARGVFGDILRIASMY